MSEYYGNNDWRDYLALKHHGILGQKWGKQNGPPYPLGYGDHSSAEKKANPKARLDNYESSSIGRKRRYITKESKRIEKRYAKDIKRLDRVLNRASKRYERSAENGPSRRTDRLEERYRDALTDAEVLKRMRDTELERLNNMTDREIKAEKKEARDKLRDLKYESDSFFGRLKERREYKKELADERGRERLTSGERNQLKEQVGKDIKSNETKIDKKQKLEEARKPLPHSSKNIIEDFGKQYDLSKNDEVTNTRVNVLFSEIQNKIVDTYSLEAHTERTKKVMDTYSPRLKELFNQRHRSDSNYSAYRKLNDEYKDKMASAVLKDLGYTDDAASRKWLLDNWFIFYD